MSDYSKDYRAWNEAASFRERINGIIGSRLGAMEIEDGFRFTYPRDGAWLERLEDAVDQLQPLIPWLDFEAAESEDGPVLTVRGGRLAKSWVESEVEFAGARSLVAGHQRSLGQRIRAVTGRFRTRPDFLVIGTPRSGTTSLYALLTRHPSIVQSPIKEIAYFNLLYGRGPTWYRTHFPTILNQLRVKLRTGGFATGEATPTYLYHPHAARRVRELLPDVKLVVLVRNPIDRAYSHYHLALQTGYETLGFEEAIEREPARIEGEWEKMLADESYISFTRGYLGYLTMGCYAEHLERWLEIFPREQLLVAPIDRIKTTDFHEELARFLELPPAELKAGKPSYKIEYPPMASETRDRLREHFRPHNERLWQLLGTDFGWND